MDNRSFGGWAVAVAVCRNTVTGWRLLARPFTVSTFEREDAERYARDEVEKDYPAADGWVIVISSMPVKLVTSREPQPPICPVCDGRGTILGFLCAACEGAGIVTP